MSRSKTADDVSWNQIFEDLVIESEPPIEYIKGALIVTKDGTRYNVSAAEFIEMVARERAQPNIAAREIFSCSINIDFSKVRRDVSKWTSSVLDHVEKNIISEMDIYLKNRKISKSKRKPK